MKDNIEKRVIGLFLLMLAILIGVAWSAVNTIQKAKETSDWVNHTHEVILGASAAVGFLHSGDASMSAFLLTSDPRDQENYRAAYHSMVNQLEVSVATTRLDAYHEDFQTLTNLIGQHINFTRSLVQAHVQGGEAAARDFAKAHPDGSSTVEIDKWVARLNDHQETLLKERDAAAVTQADSTKKVVYGGVAVNFILLIFASWLIRDDLAARRVAATAMEEANAQLEAKVQQRTAELVKSNQALKKENLERRWSYQALDHQFRYNQLIVNAISEMVFVVSKALNVSRVNPSVTQISQWEPQDLISQSIERALQVPADGSTTNPIIAALNDGREIQERPATLITKSGATIPVRFNLVPLRDDNKVVGGVVTVRPSVIPPQKTG